MPPAASCSKKALTPLMRALIGFLLGHRVVFLDRRYTGVVGRARALAHKAPVAARGNSSRPMLAATLASTADAAAASALAGVSPLRRLPRYMAASRSPVPCGAVARRRT